MIKHNQYKETDLFKHMIGFNILCRDVVSLICSYVIEIKEKFLFSKFDLEIGDVSFIGNNIINSVYSGGANIYNIKGNTICVWPDFPSLSFCKEDHERIYVASYKKHEVSLCVNGVEHTVIDKIPYPWGIDVNHSYIFVSNYEGIVVYDKITHQRLTTLNTNFSCDKIKIISNKIFVKNQNTIAVFCFDMSTVPDRHHVCHMVDGKIVVSAGKWIVFDSFVSTDKYDIVFDVASNYVYRYNYDKKMIYVHEYHSNANIIRKLKPDFDYYVKDIINNDKYLVVLCDCGYSVYEFVLSS